MARAQARIRPYRPSDLDELYRICLLTGDAGQDATALYQDPRLLGHIFAAPTGGPDCAAAPQTPRPACLRGNGHQTRNWRT